MPPFKMEKLRHRVQDDEEYGQEQQHESTGPDCSKAGGLEDRC